MGQLRQVPLTIKETEEGESKRMTFTVSSMCGWRLTMQDAHIANPNLTKTCSLFAVFDGHGGSQVSLFAKKFFEERLLKNQNFINKKYQTALSEIFESLDIMLQTKQGQKEIKKIKRHIAQKQNIQLQDGPLNSGCTAVVCLITENQIYCANAGDSRCVIYRKKTVQNMSQDHKPKNKKQLSRITKAGGVVVQGRINGCLNLSRGLGDFEFKNNKNLKWDQQMVTAKPDIIRKPLQGTEYIVLGCDGIFEQKSNREIMNMVRHKPNQSLKITAEGILNQLLAKDNQQQCGLDNMSLILVKMKL